MITPDQTTFRRLQTDNPASVTVFLSIDGTLATGEPMPGPWQGIDIALTAEEQAVAQAIVQRARVIMADRVCAPPAVPAVPEADPQMPDLQTQDAQP